MLSEILDFHRKCRCAGRSTLEMSERDSPASCYTVTRKHYRFCPALPLEPGPGSPQSDCFLALLSNRRSTRDFSSEPLKFDAISRLLYSATILDDERFPERRAYPSAGAYYPIEIYLLSYRVERLEPDTAYHLNVETGSLEQLWPIAGRLSVEQVVTEDMSTCAAALILTAVLSRQEQKYSGNAYPFSLFEAGMVAQTICLASCEVSGVGACLSGGFEDRELAGFLELPDDEIPVCTLALGYTEAD